MSVRVQTYVWQLDLTPSQKLVAIALADHCHDDGSEARPSQDLLIQKTGLSERTVRNTLRDLVDAGVVVVDRPAAQHRPNCYRFPIPEDFGTIRGATDAGLDSGGQMTTQGGKRRRSAGQPVPPNHQEPSSEPSLLSSTEVGGRPSPPRKDLAEFDDAWAAYPRKDGKKAAQKAFIARIRSGARSRDLVTAARNYAEVRNGWEVSKIMLGATFWGPNDRYVDFLDGGAGLITPPARRSRAELELDIDRTVEEVQNIFNLPPDERGGIAKGPLVVALLERYSYQQLGRMSIQEIRNVIAAMVFTPKGETA